MVVWSVLHNLWFATTAKHFERRWCVPCMIKILLIKKITLKSGPVLNLGILLEAWVNILLVKRSISCSLSVTITSHLWCCCIQCWHSPKKVEVFEIHSKYPQMWHLPAILTITNATLFTIYLRMWAVFQHRGVWSNGHRGCHTAICIRITLDASCIRPITKNVTEATSLAFERGSCVKKYTISLSIELL